jgi:hypothetical protein
VTLELKTFFCDSPFHFFGPQSVLIGTFSLDIVLYFKVYEIKSVLSVGLLMGFNIFIF